MNMKVCTSESHDMSQIVFLILYRYTFLSCNLSLILLIPLPLPSIYLHPCVAHHNLCHYGGTEGIFPPGLFLVPYSCCLACAKTDGATTFRVGCCFSFTGGAETRTRGVCKSYLRMLGWFFWINFLVIILFIIFVVCRDSIGMYLAKCLNIPKPYEKNRVSAWIYPSPSVEALYIGEYTLPVRLGVLDHVLHLQQGGDPSQLPVHVLSQVFPHIQGILTQKDQMPGWSCIPCSQGAGSSR